MAETVHWLTQMRVDAGYLTIRRLADDSGVDISTLARIEKPGGPQPTTATLKKLVPYLKVPYIKMLAFAGHLDGDPESQKIAKLLSLMTTKEIQEILKR